MARSALILESAWHSSAAESPSLTAYATVLDGEVIISVCIDGQGCDRVVLTGEEVMELYNFVMRELDREEVKE